MHCKACELLVKKTCEKHCECSITNANHKKGTITVDRSNNQIDEVWLRSAVKSCWYCICEEAKNNNISPRSWIERIALLLGAFALTFVLIKVDLLSFMSDIQADTSLRVIFLLWLVASVSTCLAVTWWVVIGFTELVDKTNDRWWDIQLHGWFQLWRVLWFFVLGSLLWYLGNVISISFGFASWLNAFIAIVFVYLWLQLLGIVPSLSSRWLHLPEKRTTYILSQNNPYLAPIVGTLTFFLPCGFTQSVQLMALASWSWLTGWLMMSVFAVGTLPWLLALGMWTSFAKDHRKQWFEQIVAMILLIFGFFTFWWSASIWWWTDRLVVQNTSISKTQIADTDIVDQNTPKVVEKIMLSHNWSQVVPETTILEAGKDYEITITPEQDGVGCMSTVTLPRIDSTVHYVKQGQAITYKIDDAKPWQFSFVCASMGMSQGKLIVQ